MPPPTALLSSPASGSRTLPLIAEMVGPAIESLESASVSARASEVRAHLLLARATISELLSLLPAEP